jgi:hypothetical protein
MALNLPTPGESARLAPMRVKGPVVPKTFTTNPSKPKAPKAPKSAGVNPYDQFTLPDPYDPSKVGALAQSGYDADVANAQKLAAMGQPSSASIGADYAARGAASNQIFQALAQHLAGIQSASVAQGNAGSAALGAQNAAAAGTMPNIPGAAPAGSPIPTQGAQAVLGAQTAATGNYGGALQAAALSSGTQANQRALDAGTIASQSNDQNIQKTLASLLSGVPLVSARQSSMLGENQKVDASNLQTKLSVYQNLVNQKQYAQTLGSKTAIAAADNALKQWTTQQSNATKNALNIQDNQTKITTTNATNRTRAQIAADNAAARVAAAKTTATAKLKAAKTTAAAKTKTGGAGGVTASGKRQALTQAIKIATSEGGKKVSAPSQYTAKIQKVLAGGATDPLAPNATTVPVDPSKVNGWKPPAGYKVIAPPTVSKTSSKTVNRPGSYTKYNRAVSYLKQTGYTDAQARAALRQYHP